VSSQVGILAHNQPTSAKASCHIPRAMAEEMVQRMVAERISSKIIRRFAPDSVFPVLKPSRLIPTYRDDVPSVLPPSEIPNCYFQQPLSAAWRIVRPNIDFMLPEERHLASI
jgi:hypothetical protein